MISALISRLIILIFGTLYPAYSSYKAVKTKNVRAYVDWMMYWIVFAFFSTLEIFTDIFISFWIPFYYELKILFLIWLLSPYTKGTSIVYKKFIHPVLKKYEQDIDFYLESAKNRGYKILVRFGSRGFMYVKDAVTTAAIKGQIQLLNQLTKSYSLNDVDDRTNSNRTDADVIDRGFDDFDDEDDLPLSMLIKKNTSNSIVSTPSMRVNANLSRRGLRAPTDDDDLID